MSHGHSLFEKRSRTEIRPVDLHVAERAGLKLGGLIVKRRSSRCVAEGRHRVALQAKHVHALLNFREHCGAGCLSSEP